MRLSGKIVVSMVLAEALLLGACADLLHPLPKEHRYGAGRGAYLAMSETMVRDEEARIPGFEPGPHFSEELRVKIQAQQLSLGDPPDNIPVVPNEEVRAALIMFLTSGRKFLVNSLERSSKYVPMIQEIFEDRGLPVDLAYLPLVESGYNKAAVSPAGAVGLWQFIPDTGRRYGLKVNLKVDERLDPVKSTHAAASYLEDLHGMLGCWHLAAAAYNAGEGKILGGIKKFKTHDFWEISEQKFLADETKKYVPYFLAALVIAKDPERFGLSTVAAGNENPSLVMASGSAVR